MNRYEPTFFGADNKDANRRRPHAAPAASAFTLGALIANSSCTRPRAKPVSHAATRNNPSVSGDNRVPKYTLHLRPARQTFLQRLKKSQAPNNTSQLIP